MTTTYAMPITLDRTEEWLDGHVGGYLLDAGVIRTQTFTVAAGDLLDLSVVVPVNPFKAQYGVDYALSTRLVRAAVGFGISANRGAAENTPGLLTYLRAANPAQVHLENGVEFDGSATQTEPAVVDSAGGTWRPPATLWTAARSDSNHFSYSQPLAIVDFVDAGTGFLRFPTSGAITVSVYLLLRRYQDTAAVAARQAAGIAALLAERASTAAQRAAQTGQWH